MYGRSALLALTCALCLFALLGVVVGTGLVTRAKDVSVALAQDSTAKVDFNRSLLATALGLCYYSFYELTEEQQEINEGVDQIVFDYREVRDNLKDTIDGESVTPIDLRQMTDQQRVSLANTWVVEHGYEDACPKIDETVYRDINQLDDDVDDLYHEVEDIQVRLDLVEATFSVPGGSNTLESGSSLEMLCSISGGSDVNRYVPYELDCTVE